MGTDHLKHINVISYSMVCFPESQDCMRISLIIILQKKENDNKLPRLVNTNDKHMGTGTNFALKLAA
jgi:hypothetical protein